MSDSQRRIVIVGGGFGGIHVAKALKKAPVEVVLIDRRNFHLFQPLLYQVATAGLSPANIAAPLRKIFRHQKNAEVVLGEVVGFDANAKTVELRDGTVAYDTLVVAAGSETGYFGNHGWEAVAPGLKTMEDATQIRRRVLYAFEAAEKEDDPEARRAWLTFLIVGGGPTGVELAGAIAELARRTLRDDFRRIDPGEASIQIIEGSDQILHTFAPDLAAKAAKSIARLGVTVRVQTTIKDVHDSYALVEHNGSQSRIASRTILWAAGVQGSELAKALARAFNCEIDRGGRVMVQPNLTIKDHEDVFVLGDLAQVNDASGRPLPGVAPVAIQQGTYAGKTIAGRIRGEKGKAFKYRDKGAMATIGRAAAIAQFGRFRFSGLFAWLVWLFIHLMALVQFENRLLVFMQWAWAYMTFNKSARLITDLPEKPK